MIVAIEVVACALVLTSCNRSAPADELAFLASFKHTARVDDDGQTSYRIEGDPATIRAAIPGASGASAEVSAQGTTYNFTFPSGKRATFVPSPKPGRASLLIVESEPSPSAPGL